MVALVSRRGLATRSCKRSYDRGRLLCFEPLEQRQLLSVCQWVGAGSTNAWSDSGNWLRNGQHAVPVAGDDLTFTGTAQTATRNDLEAGISFRSLDFASDNFSLSGNSIALTAGITVESGVAGSAIALNIALGGALAVNVVNTSLVVSGVVSGSNSLQKTGGGTLTMGGLNTYGGGTTISAGTLEASSLTALPGYNNLPSSTVTVASGAILAAANASDFATLSSNAASNITYNTGSFLGFDTGAGCFSYASAIGNSYANMGLAKLGAGTLALSGTNTYSGGTMISAGVLEVSSLATLPGYNSVPSKVTVAGGAVLAAANASDFTTLSSTTASNIAYNSGSFLGFDTGSGNVTYAGIIGSGYANMGLAKLGAGTLTLTGANTYAGATAIENGTVVVSGGSNRLPASTALTLGTNTTSGVLQLGDATGAADQTLARLLSSVNGELDNRVVGGSATTSTLTINLTGAIDFLGILGGDGVNQDNISLVQAGTGYLSLDNVNSYRGGTLIKGGTMRLAANSTGGPAVGRPGTLGSGPVSISSGGTLLLYNATHTGSYANDISGDGILVKDYIDTAVLTGKVTVSTIDIKGGALQLGDGSTNGSVAGNIVLENGAAVVFNYGSDLTYGGAIGGSGSLTQKGADRLTLTGSNTYSGSTTVSAGGTLQAATPGSLSGYNSTPSRITVSSGGTLAVNVGGAGQWGSADMSALLSDVALNGGSVLGIDTTNAAGGQFAYAGNITGALGVTKLGTGTLILSGQNAYTGGTIVSAGILEVPTLGALPGYQGPASNVTVAAGAILAVANASDFAALSSSTTSNIAYNTGSFLGFDTGSGNVTYASAIGNSYPSMGVAKLGAGTLTLSGADTYGGTTRIVAGTLALSNSWAMQQTTLDMNAADAGNLDFGSLATARLGGLMGPRALSLQNDSSSAVRLLLGYNDTDTTYSGNLSGSGGLTKLGSGVLTLAGANVHTGGTKVLEGVLEVSTLSALPSYATSGKVWVVQGATLAVTSTGDFAALSSSVTSQITYDPEAFLGFDTGSGNITYSGNIGDANYSGMGLAKLGSGMLTLTGNNIYTGGTTINAGVLEAKTPGSLPGYNSTSPNITVNSGGTLAVNVGGAGEWNATDIDTLRNNVTFGGVSALGIDSTDAGTDGFTYASNITGGLGVTKLGSGTLILTGTNTYTGPTIVAQGEVSVIGSIASNEVVVSSGAILSGNGLDPPDSTTVSGTLSPGTPGVNGGVGTLTTSNLIFTAGSIFNVDLTSSGCDRVNVAGSVTLGSASLHVSHTGANNASNVLVLIDDQGTNAVVGTFQGLDEGSELLVDGVAYWITYRYNAEGSTFGDGNDVALVNLPSNRPADFGQQWVRQHPFMITGWDDGPTVDPQLLKDAGLNTLLTWGTDLTTYSQAGVSWEYNLGATNGLTSDIVSRAVQQYALGGPSNASAWYILDEPQAKSLNGLHEVSSWVKNQYPNMLSYSITNNTDQAYLENYISTVNPDVLAYDIYPCFRSWNGTSYDPLAMYMGDVFHQGMAIRNAGLEHNLPYFVTVPSFVDPGGPYRLPSESELRAISFSYLTMGYKGLMYFYWSHPDPTNYSSLASDAALFAAAQAMNPEIATLGSTLRFATSTAVGYIPGQVGGVSNYPIPINPPGHDPGGVTTTLLPDWSPTLQGGDSRITNIHVVDDGAQNNAVVGFFQDDNNEKLFMITNLNQGIGLSASQTAETIRITFDSSVTSLLHFNRDTGVQEVIPIPANHVLEITLPGGTGDLYKFNDGVGFTRFSGQLAGVNVGATEGQAFSGQVASFANVGASAVVANFTATITWGDGHSSPGTITSDGSGGFIVSGSNTYTAAGSYTIGVTIGDASGATESTTSTASVADALLTALGINVMTTEGAAFTGQVATFTDADSGAVATNFTATITWGDGHTSPGTITSNGSGGFIVSGSNTYAASGSYAVSVTINDVGGATKSTGSTAGVADAPLTATGINIGASEGQAFSGQVATFIDANPGAVAANFTASIIWGDGHTSPGTITSNGSGGFIVSGSNTYAASGSYAVAVAIRDKGGATQFASGTATVADAALTATGINLGASEGQAFTGQVANFTDADPGAVATNFTATITWGDGHTSPGTITSNGSGGFIVSGSNTYAEEASYAVGVTINDVGGATKSTTSTASVADAPLVVSVAAISPTETTAFSGVVASFTDTGGAELASEYKATINWGDGTINTGTVSLASGNTLNVSGSHTYATAATNTITVTVVDDGNTSTPGATASGAKAITVADSPLTAVTGGFALTATEGKLSSTQTVATFKDSATAESLSHYTATINWGDGGPASAGTISYNSSTKVFTVKGSHNYAEEGTYSVSVTLYHDTLAPVTAPSSQATVADAPLSATGVSQFTVNKGVQFTAKIAQFTDADPTGTASDYTVTINWGDGSPLDTTTGSVTGSGPFSVYGTHTYNPPTKQTFTVTITVKDHGASAKTATPIYDPPLTQTTDSTTSVASLPLIAAAASVAASDAPTSNGRVAKSSGAAGTVDFDFEATSTLAVDDGHPATGAGDDIPGSGADSSGTAWTSDADSARQSTTGSRVSVSSVQVSQSADAAMSPAGGGAKTGSLADELARKIVDAVMVGWTRLPLFQRFEQEIVDFDGGALLQEFNTDK